MVKTLGVGRLPRTGVANNGLKVQVGTVTKGGTPGSFAIQVKSVKHISVRSIASPTASSGSWYRIIPYGTNSLGYAYVNTMYVGTGAKPLGTSTAQTFSFMVYGD
jgi:hypothetical protein